VEWADQWEAMVECVDQWEATAEWADQWEAMVEWADQWEATVEWADQWEARALPLWSLTMARASPDSWLRSELLPTLGRPMRSGAS